MPTSPRRPALRTAAAAGAALLAAAGVAALAVPARANAATAPTSKVLRDTVTGLSALKSLGPVRTGQPMTVGVWIPGDTAGLKAYANSISDPKSAIYGQTLSAAELDARFGVNRTVSEAAQKQVEAHGLKAVYVARDQQYVLLSGTAAQVERTFKVSLTRYSALGKTFYANTNNATVPTAVGAVLGLTNLQNFHTADSQDLCDVIQGECNGTLTAGALTGTYNVPSGDQGQGQKIAIFGEGDLTNVVGALRAYEDATQVNQIGNSPDLTKPVLPHVPVREVLVNDPQNSSADTAGADEWDLDSQSSTGQATKLDELDFYFGSDLSDQSIQATYSAWINDDNGPMIGNSSFGGCEYVEQLSGGEATDDALLAQAVALGRTMFVSSGDSGAGGCAVGANAGQPSVLAVEDPAGSSYATAVGGTAVYTTSDGTGAQAQPPTRAREYGWYDSGGGYATFSAMSPAQQAVVASGPTSIPTPEPCVAEGGKNCREVPDVAAMSGDGVANAYDVVEYDSSTNTASDIGVFGTSISSPVWAGLWALVRAPHKTDGSCTTVASSKLTALKFAQSALYDVAGNGHDDVFFDVGSTTGSNPSINYVYPTLPKSTPNDPTGYDLVTGLGSPDLTKLITVLDCGTTPVSTSTSRPALTILDANSLPSAFNGVNCPPNGIATDAVGDESPAADSGVDLTSGKVAGDATGVTFTLTTKSGAVTPDDGYAVFFGYGQGVQYGVDLDTAGGPGYGAVGGTPNPGTPTFRLFKNAAVVAPTLGPIQFYPSYLATLTGKVDLTNGIYTVNLPYATFNSVAALTGASALGPGKSLSGVEALSGQEPTFSLSPGQQVVSDTMQFPCLVNLAGNTDTGPGIAPTLPEAGAPVALVAAGLLAGLFLRRRRRA